MTSTWNDAAMSSSLSATAVRKNGFEIQASKFGAARRKKYPPASLKLMIGGQLWPSFGASFGVRFGGRDPLGDESRELLRRRFRRRALGEDPVDADAKRRVSQCFVGGLAPCSGAAASGRSIRCLPDHGP